MHQKLGPTLARSQRFLDERIRPQVVADARDFEILAAEPIFEPVSFVDATTFSYTPFAIGTHIAPAWHTRWFRLSGNVPSDWKIGEHDCVAAHFDLGFIGNYDGFQVEAMLFVEGKPVQAIQPDRRRYVIEGIRAGKRFEAYLEVAATPMVSNRSMGKDLAGPLITPYADPDTSPASPLYRFNVARIELRRRTVEALALEFDSVLNLVTDLEADDPMRDRGIRALEDSIASLDAANVADAVEAARAPLRRVLSAPAAPASHTVYAVGHAHLDTAWLWPLRETRRKAARTFVNAVGLAGRHPRHVFTASQAQQYEWVRRDHPEVFERITELVAAGKWSPVGGMWVEADLNLSGGESLCRQFLQGQRSFEKWFGVRSDVAFLPDDFGYPGSLPQIVNLGGCKYFFTQKLSWNETNTFPHHSFWWQGIDGTRVFTHFSPIDTYNALNTPAQLRFASRNFRDHGVSSVSLSCFGHGDGGGGPTDEMVERTALLSNTHGVPRTRFATPSEFFADAVREAGDHAATWVGELYLEKHRGTLTTQVKTKQGSLRAERALREAELWSVAARRPVDLTESWQNMLTQQFHDILPGSSITWVHRDAERILGDVVHEAHVASVESLNANAAARTLTLVNPCSFDHCGVLVTTAPVDLPDGEVTAVQGDWRSPVQRLASGEIAFVCTIPALSTALVEFESEACADPELSVVVSEGDRIITVTNDVITMSLDVNGDIVSLVHAPTDREVVPRGIAANSLVLRSDLPGEYDAWDIDEPDTRGEGAPMRGWAVHVVDHGPLVVTIRRSAVEGPSHFVHDISVLAGESMVRNNLTTLWNHDETRLQVTLPVDVHSTEATCGIQFGHVNRPRHANSSWDAAKFEVCAHRYAHVGEPNFGVSLMCPGPHGFDVRGNALRMSLLRSPRFPDPVADRGEQHLEWVVRVNAQEVFSSGLEADAHRFVDAAYAVAGVSTVEPPVRVDIRGAVVEAVKFAEDGSGDVIVRMWESAGDRTAGTLHVRGAREAWNSNVLEDCVELLEVSSESVSVSMSPFEIVTIRVRL